MSPSQFTSVRERLPELVSNGQSISKRSPPTHQRTSRPHPTLETKLHLPVPLRDKKELNESSRRLFFFFPSIIYHSASEHKKKKVRKKRFVWEGGKPRTLVGSENMFRCLYMSGYILFDMCIALHLSTLPCSLFSNIYIKASKKYIKQHVSIHSQFSPKGINKNLTP